MLFEEVVLTFHQPKGLAKVEIFYYVGGLRLAINSRTWRKGSKVMSRIWHEDLEVLYQKKQKAEVFY